MVYVGSPGFIRSTVRRGDKRDKPIRNESTENRHWRTAGRDFWQVRTDCAEEHTARQDHWQAARRCVYSVGFDGAGRCLNYYLYIVNYRRFNKREEAQEAIAALNNVIPEGSNQPLTVRVAEEHGKTKAQQMFGAPLSPMTMGLSNHHMNMSGSSMNMGGSNMSMGASNMMNSMGGYPMPPGGPHHSGAMHRGRSRYRFAHQNAPY